ncbi:MAG TPA: 5'-3' exonuclease H3TH domain-containing protein, partial [Pyrinomonadaceae bacterium]|nr:5'-3' exonuclease H3TH domain-containing protein [Pyrinomonadaceae bacterium]
EAAIIAKFGVLPKFIPDYLALVGDSADGYPGIKGLGARTAATLIDRHGHIEDFPVEALSDENRKLALLFKDLATLRTDLPLFKRVDELWWQGPAPSFEPIAQKIDAQRLVIRVDKLAKAARNSSRTP